MILRAVLILFFVLEIQSVSIAQKSVRHPSLAEDTLSSEELNELSAAERNTAFGYFQIAESFSHHNDSINASACFMKIDPYYFLKPQLQLPPASFESVILDSFKLTKT